MLNMFKKMFNMSKEATQSKFDNLWSNSLTAWHIVCVLKYLRVAFKFIMSSYCQ